MPDGTARCAVCCSFERHSGVDISNGRVFRRAVFAEAAELGALWQRARKHDRKIAAPHEGKKENEEEEELEESSEESAE